MHGELLFQMWVCVIAAAFLAYAAKVARQPLILAYIGAGILIGPLALGLIGAKEGDADAINTLAELGLIFLLFIVGLEIDIKKLLRIGRSAFPVTLVQVAGSALLGYLTARALGYHGLDAIYLAIAVAFSSTMIAVKLLTDRSELDTAHGQMTLGVLLLQDVFAIAVLALQPHFKDGISLGVVGVAAGKGALLVLGVWAISRFILPPLFRWMAASPEMVLLSAISWCFLVCVAAQKLQFSVAMGALIAGVTMSAFPYATDIVAKIRGLRTFFVTLFFVSMGLLLTKPTWNMVGAALLLSAVVMASRFVTVWPAMRAVRYAPRIGVLTSIYLAQVSEFGLVIGLIGLQAYHHISRDLISVIVMVMIVTSAGSTYLIQFSHRIAALFVSKARALEGDRSQSTVLVHDDAGPAVMLIGCFRVGSSLVHELRQASVSVSVIDVSQNVNEKLNRLGVPTIYGDISHADTLEHAGVETARILISSISDDFLRGTDNLHLLRTLRKLNPHAKIIVTSESIRKAQELYAAGADYVILTRVLVARHLLEVISEIGAGILEERREKEVKHLGHRVEVVP